MKTQVLSKAILFLAFVSFACSETIKLPEPKKTGGKPLYEVFAKRQSSRFFADNTLTDAQMSQLLWSAYGINREITEQKTVPSAVAAYPIDIYVFLKKGTYLYKPSTHSLELVLSGDSRGLTTLDFPIELADMNVCLFGVYNRVFFAADKEAAAKDIRLDSGFINANMYLTAADLGLQAVTRARFDQQVMFDALGLSANDYYIPLCFSVGN